LCSNIKAKLESSCFATPLLISLKVKASSFTVSGVKFMQLIQVKNAVNQSSLWVDSSNINQMA
jgi:hypothetical protein